MQIRGTKKLQKKTLDLSSIRQQIKAGQTLPISDDHFNNHDIQIALGMGLIESNVQTNTKRKAPQDPNRIIECQNAMDKPLALPFRRDEEGKPLFEKEILPKDNFTIAAKHMDTPEMRAAISQGLIRVVTADAKNDYKDTDTTDYTEATVKIRDLIRGGKSKSDKSVSSCQEKLVAAAQKLDTNEEIGALSKEVNNPDEDEDEDEIVWNPGTKKTVKGVGPSLADTAIRTSATSESKPAAEIRGVAATRYVDSEEPIKVDPNADDPRVNPATVMNPTGKAVITKTGAYDPTVMESPKDTPKTIPLSKEEAAMISGTNDAKEIKFVDAEQEKTRRVQHPVLGSKEEITEEDLDFV